MKNWLASLIVLAIMIKESKPKPKVIYSKVSYKQDRHHENWNDYLRGTGL